MILSGCNALNKTTFESLDDLPSEWYQETGHASK